MWSFWCPVYHQKHKSFFFSEYPSSGQEIVNFWTKTHLTAVNHKKIFLPFILQLISKSTFSINGIFWQIKILAIKTDSCQGYMIYDLDIFYKDKFSDLHLAQQTLLHKKNTDLQFLYCIVYATITFSLTKLNQ